ncbi:MAG: hypothetical protein AAF564_26715 [Bacteroidota bacterium]
MSTSRRKKSTRRTKEQLLQELEVTQRLLIEKEEELVLCQEELARYLQQPKNGEQQHHTDTLLDKIAGLESTLNSTSTELENAQKANSNQASRLAKQDKKIDKLEKQLKKLKQAQVETQASSTQPTPITLPPDGPDSFLVPEVAIHHTNAKEQQQQGPAKADGKAKGSKAKTNTATKPRPTSEERYSVPIQIAPITQLIKENTPFDAAINVDVQAMKDSAVQRLRCRTRLFARRFADGWSSQIGEIEATYDAGNTAVTTIKDVSLPAGLYHLQAVAAFTTPTGDPLPIASIHEGELLQVVV